jgi:hypothetical protein
MPDVHLTSSDTKLLRDMLKDFPSRFGDRARNGVLLNAKTVGDLLSLPTWPKGLGVTYKHLRVRLERI